MFYLHTEYLVHGNIYKQTIHDLDFLLLHGFFGQPKLSPAKCSGIILKVSDPLISYSSTSGKVVF